MIIPATIYSVKFESPLIVEVLTNLQIEENKNGYISYT